jgi:hypothetical protein
LLKPEHGEGEQVCELLMLVGERLAKLVLLVLILGHFKPVHFFDQQFNYHSSFGFACRRIAQSAIEHNVSFLQESLHRDLLPNFFGENV